VNKIETHTRKNNASKQLELGYTTGSGQKNPEPKGGRGDDNPKGHVKRTLRSQGVVYRKTVVMSG